LGFKGLNETRKNVLVSPFRRFWSTRYILRTVCDIAVRINFSVLHVFVHVVRDRL